MNDDKKLLIKILDITDYQGDREEFANHFMYLILEEAVYLLMQSLPEKKREKVASQWEKNLNNPAAITSLLKHNFSEGQIKGKTEISAEKAIQEYLQSVSSTLSEKQKQQLVMLSEGIEVSTDTSKEILTYRRIIRN